MASATVGINGRLMTYGAATLRLKGEGSLAQLDVSKSGGLFQGASANLQRLRLAAEVEYEHVIPDVGVCFARYLTTDFPDCFTRSLPGFPTLFDLCRSDAPVLTVSEGGAVALSD